MRVYLAVPYSEKDQAKALGARWDVEKRKWYLIDPENLDPFLKWTPECHEFAEKAKQKVKPPRRYYKGKPIRPFRNNVTTYPAPGVVILPYDDFDCPPWE